MRVYCGTKLHLPEGYDMFGTPYECLKKGFGVGMYKNKKSSNIWLYLFIAVLLCLTALVMYTIITEYSRETFKKNINDKKTT